MNKMLDYIKNYFKKSSVLIRDVYVDEMRASIASINDEDELKRLESIFMKLNDDFHNTLTRFQSKISTLLTTVSIIFTLTSALTFYIIQYKKFELTTSGILLYGFFFIGLLGLFIIFLLLIQHQKMKSEYAEIREMSILKLSSNFGKIDSLKNMIFLYSVTLAKNNISIENSKNKFKRIYNPLIIFLVLTILSATLIIFSGRNQKPNNDTNTIKIECKESQTSERLSKESKKRIK